MVSYLDLLLLIPIGWAIWKGWRNGFVMELFSMLSLFVGLYAAIHTSNWVARFLRDKVEVKAEYLPVISFILVLLVVIIGLYFLGKLITKTVKAGGGEKMNNLGGAFFSLSKFLLAMSVAFIFFNMLDAKYGLLPEEQKKRSYFYEPIYNFSLFLLPSIKESAFFQKLKEKEMAPISLERHSKKENAGRP